MSIPTRVVFVLLTAFTVLAVLAAPPVARALPASMILTINDSDVVEYGVVKRERGSGIGRGNWTYDAATNTLTLNDCILNYIHGEYTDHMTIIVNGTVDINRTNALCPLGLYKASHLSLKGAATSHLTCTNVAPTNGSPAIYAEGDLTIDGNLTITARGSRHGISSAFGTLTVTGNPTITAETQAGVTAEHAPLSASAVHIAGGTITCINPANSTTPSVYAMNDDVTLTGGTLTAPNGITADAGGVTIAGGSVYAPWNKIAPAPKNAAGQAINNPTGAALIALTVVGGTGTGTYPAGTTVPIAAATAPSGQTFDTWSSNGGGAFQSATAARTSFELPNRPVTVVACYRSTAAGGSGNGSAASGGSGGSAASGGAAGSVQGITMPVTKPTVKKVGISKLKVGKRKLTVTWKKLAASQQVTKYQVRWRIKGKAKWSKVKTLAASKKSYIISGLKKGKRYQVQVRAYRKITTGASAGTYYSAWSATKISGKLK
ncbi:MAG: fibronectin type III domain-containing protein [Actinomycetes bacterium]|jgi:hypothetical protein|nr:fibronectin type III domain-containing protein [Actinomycetes bacterium]